MIMFLHKGSWYSYTIRRAEECYLAPGKFPSSDVFHGLDRIHDVRQWFGRVMGSQPCTSPSTTYDEWPCICMHCSCTFPHTRNTGNHLISSSVSRMSVRMTEMHLAHLSTDNEWTYGSVVRRSNSKTVFWTDEKLDQCWQEKKSNIQIVDAVFWRSQPNLIWAEGLGDWDLHFRCFKEMLPYFHAAVSNMQSQQCFTYSR